MPFDALPSLFDPPEGVIVTANARAVGAGYPYHLATRWGDVPLRQRRIRELLDAKPRLSLDDVAAIQLDVQEGRADTLVAWARSVASDAPDVRRFQEALAAWDLRTDASSVAAALAEAFRVELVPRGVRPTAVSRDVPVAISGREPASIRSRSSASSPIPDARFFGPEPRRRVRRPRRCRAARHPGRHRAARGRDGD